MFCSLQIIPPTSIPGYPEPPQPTTGRETYESSATHPSRPPGSPLRLSIQPLKPGRNSGRRPQPYDPQRGGPLRSCLEVGSRPGLFRRRRRSWSSCSQTGIAEGSLLFPTREKKPHTHPIALLGGAVQPGHHFVVQQEEESFVRHLRLIHAALSSRLGKRPAAPAHPQASDVNRAPTAPLRAEAA